MPTNQTTNRIANLREIAAAFDSVSPVMAAKYRKEANELEAANANRRPCASQVWA